MIKQIESGIAGKGLNFNNLHSIKKVADDLELNGVLSFKDDGSIKVIAEGEEENLKKFTKKLEKASFFYLIENFYLIWHNSIKGFNNFSIINN